MRLNVWAWFPELQGIAGTYYARIEGVKFQKL